MPLGPFLRRGYSWPHRRKYGCEMSTTLRCHPRWAGKRRKVGSPAWGVSVPVGAVRAIQHLPGGARVEGVSLPDNGPDGTMAHRETYAGHLAGTA